MKKQSILVGALIISAFTVSAKPFLHSLNTSATNLVTEATCGDKMAKDSTAKPTEGKCGEGKCGEGKCGDNKVETKKGKSCEMKNEEWIQLINVNA